MAKQTQKRSSGKYSPDKRPSDKGDNAHNATELGGPKGPEPTRYGDWEKNGRCTDF